MVILSIMNIVIVIIIDTIIKIVITIIFYLPGPIPSPIPGHYNFLPILQLSVPILSKCQLVLQTHSLALNECEMAPP